MISLMSLNRDGSFDVSYSNNEDNTKHKQAFVELTVKKRSQQQEEFDPDNINSPEFKRKVTEQITASNTDESEQTIRFYSIYEDPRGNETNVVPVNLQARKLSAMYDDWIRDETNNPNERPQDHFISRFNRLNKMKRLKKQDEQQEQHKFKFSLNLTQLLLAQMNVSKGLQNLLILNMVIDMLFRLNLILFMVIAVLQNPHNLISLFTFLYLPRLLHILTMTELLFLDKYNPYNKRILNLSHLVRSNFIDEDGFVNYNIHPCKRTSVLNVINIRSIFFMVLPVEFCIISLPLSSRFKKRRAIKTYILMSYILKGIEAILFQPVFLFLMVSNYYAFDKLKDNYSYQYQYFTLFMVIVDISKYVILSILLLLRGNKQKQDVKEKMLKAIKDAKSFEEVT